MSTYQHIPTVSITPFSVCHRERELGELRGQLDAARAEAEQKAAALGQRVQELEQAGGVLEDEVGGST